MGTAGTRVTRLNERFARFSRRCAEALGSPAAFASNCLLILLWLCSGPLFAYSNTWQLVVNTVTTVFTYLAVFIIQNTQNRDARAMHLKLDELISSIEGARNRLVDLEELTDEEISALQRQFQRLQKRAAARAEDAVRAIHGDPEEPVDAANGPEGRRD
ncbi:MAG TPA: low affinity iron permease family protein [Steroidobacteraceae bacterium]|nr:low affinity iron permease family protein [Steroidobacteraceae bacterium]